MKMLLIRKCFKLLKLSPSELVTRPGDAIIALRPEKIISLSIL